jgi:S-adenosylmethionine-dependent methyltransferase
MVDDISDIKAYYDKATAAETDRLDRHQLEHDITWRSLDEYLPSEGNVLEIGCGTGAITISLAERGYKVTAVDLSEKMIEIAGKRLKERGLGENVVFQVKDARDLSGVGGAFDAVLSMGSLYHLVYREDRILAIREAYSRLRPGGVIFTAFISRYGIWGDILKQIPHIIENQAEVRSVLDQGRDLEDIPPEGVGFRGYFSTVPEIRPLHEEIGFETLVLAGVEPCISADDESYNRLQGETRKAWLDLFYKLSTEESLIASSRHLLYIGKRPG